MIYSSVIDTIQSRNLCPETHAVFLHKHSLLYFFLYREGLAFALATVHDVKYSAEDRAED